jgi:hypothetical protein
MALHRAIASAAFAGVIVALGGPASAQAPQPSAGFSQGGAQQAPPCFNEFLPLRNEAEKRAGAIQAGVKRKVERPVLCKLFTQFVEAEAKYVKFMTENSTWCGIPKEAVAQVKAGHVRSVKTKNQVCSAAAAPAPRGPSLSDAMGTSRVPDPNNTTGSGTFGTLSGSAIK